MLLRCSAQPATTASAQRPAPRPLETTRRCPHSCGSRLFSAKGTFGTRYSPLRSLQPGRLHASRKPGTDLEATSDGDPAGTARLKVALIAVGALLAVLILPRLAVWSIMPVERMLVATLLNFEQKIASLAFVALRWIAIAFGVIFALAFILVLLGPETRVEWGIRDVVNTALEDELKEDTQEKNKGQK